MSGKNKIDGSMLNQLTLLGDNSSIRERRQELSDPAEGFAHILMVSNDKEDHHMAKEILESCYYVECVDSGQEAFDALEKIIPDLILMDADMSGTDVFALIRQFKNMEKCREIPVILLTKVGDSARNMSEMEVKGVAAGAADFILKPYAEEVLLFRVHRVLEHARLKKNLQREVSYQTKEAERRRKQVERLSVQVIEALVSAIDAKDEYTNGHSIRVAEYSREIARRYGLPEKTQADIYYMALLHDIGKIGIPDQIIQKTSGLTPEEYELVLSHPTIGSEILQHISEMPGIDTAARWHHEKYDGTGYPDGLKGEEIPEFVRIIGVADAYDAMSSKRSYRDVLPQGVVRSEIVGGRGTQFDPKFADILLQMIDEDTNYDMREK